MKAGRIEGLDALRGLAALGVVAFHYTHPHPEIFGTAKTTIDAAWGRVGVHLFFIISGFVIFLTLDRVRTIGVFAAGRFARLYPAYLAGIAFTTGAQIWGGLPVIASAQTLGPNLLMMARPLGSECIEMSYWTLSFELWFYVWAALFVRYCSHVRVEAFCLIVLAAGPLSLFITKSPLIHTALLFGYAQYFVIGIVFYSIHRKRGRPITYVTLAVAVASCFAFKDMDVPAIAFGVTMAALAGLAWLGIAGRLPAAFAGALSPIGEISYSLYLIHPSAGLALMRRLIGDGWSPDLAAAAALALALVVATIFNRAIERPAQQWIMSRVLTTGHRDRLSRSSSTAAP